MFWITTLPTSWPDGFENRWNDRWCVDITGELVQVIEESWAREELLPPYQVYVKMAYHLAQEGTRRAVRVPHTGRVRASGCSSIKWLQSRSRHTT